MKSKTSDQKWLIENILPSDGVGILSGEAGSFKTWILLHIAASVAGGTKVFDTFDVQQGGVLMVDEENRIALLKERIRLLGISEDLPIHFLVRKGVDFGGDEYSCEEIGNFALQNNIRLVTFDSLIRVQKRDENDARAMSEFFERLKVFQFTNSSVLITHHHRKEFSSQSSRPSQNLRGSSDILAALDSHLAVYKKGRNEMQVIQTKSRDAETLAPFSLKVEADNDHFKFIHFGEAAISTKQIAEVKIMEILQKTKEVSRKDLVDKLHGTVGGNALGDALAELESEQKISSKITAKGKKLYSLVTQK